MAEPSWFGVFDTARPLEQGVILRDLPYFDVTSQNKETFSGKKKVDLVTSDVIIMTQSCDLANGKAKHIHVCPLFELEDYFNQLGLTSVNKKKGEFEVLQKNRDISKFITNRFNLKAFPEMKNDYYVVALDLAIVLSSSYINSFAAQKKKRPILKPPYRESLAQAYGLYFMRVGNPVNMESPTFTQTAGS